MSVGVVCDRHDDSRQREQQELCGGQQPAGTFARVRLETRLRKFWLISARSPSGSDAAATLLAACSPASFRSQTWAGSQDTDTETETDTETHTETHTETDTVKHSQTKRH